MAEDLKFQVLNYLLITAHFLDQSHSSLYLGLSLPSSIPGPGHAKMCLMPYANNKGADQTAHPRSLISTFVVRCLHSMICILSIFKISKF